MHGSIGIGASYRLLQCRQDIIMLVAVTVVAHIAALGKRPCGLQPDGEVLTVIFGAQAAKLDSVHRLSDIAAAAV